MDRLSMIPLYLQLKNDIVDKIEKGIWKVGTQIPSEKELVLLNDVGRETVRKAVSILVQEGYLIKKRGIGTFVANQKPSIGFEPLLSLSHLLQVRGIKEKNRIIEDKKITIDGKLSEFTKINEMTMCKYIKKLRYVDGKTLAIEYVYLSQDKNKKQYNYEKSIISYLLDILKVNISKVEQVITPRLPSADEANILDISINDKIIEMDRWVYVEDNQSACLYIKLIIPEDLYSFSF